jgi:hypothetical protein
MEPANPAAVNPYAPPANPPEGAAPPPAATARYRPLRALVTVLTVALAAYCLCCLVTIATDAFVMGQLGRLFAGEQVDRAGLTEVVLIAKLVRLGQTLAKLVVAVAFCLFMPRANRNARAFGRMPLAITPGLSVGYFFIPILSLWMPLQTMKEIWLASEPDPDPRVDPRSLEVPDLLWLWWVAFMVHSLALLIMGKVGDKTPAGVLRTSWVEIFASALGIAAAALAVAVVRAVARRQEQCQAAIARAGSPVTP